MKFKWMAGIALALMAAFALAGDKVLNINGPVSNHQSPNMDDGSHLDNSGGDIVTHPSDASGSGINNFLGVGTASITWTWDEDCGEYYWTCPGCGALWALEFSGPDYMGRTTWTLYHLYPDLQWGPVTSGYTTAEVITQ